MDISCNSWDVEIQQIHVLLDEIESSVNESDPHGVDWFRRVVAVQKAFRILNEPRFILEPVNLRSVQNGLENLREILDLAPKVEGIERTTEPEDIHARMQFLYGLAWAQLSAAEYSDAADLLRRRLLNSNLSTEFIKGARCLDVGTGIGRFALALLQLGADYVVAPDFSQECLAEAGRRLSNLPERDRIELVHGDIYKFPAEYDSAFDVVCANGVLHHMDDPEKAIAICHRMTRNGGYNFFFVFSGNDAPWWHCIEMMRRLLSPVPILAAKSIIDQIDLTGATAFNVLDYSYTPIQFKLPVERYEQLFQRLGYENVWRLTGGNIHDSELRARLFSTDAALYGVSEVRYLLKK